MIIVASVTEIGVDRAARHYSVAVRIVIVSSHDSTTRGYRFPDAPKMVTRVEIVCHEASTLNLSFAFGKKTLRHIRTCSVAFLTNSVAAPNESLSTDDCR